MTLQRETVEEIMEAVWVAREHGAERTDQVQQYCEVSVDDATLKTLENDGYIVLQSTDIAFTPVGEKLAKAVIRRHRLAERLMVDVLGMDEKSIEKTACEFEHVISNGVEETICTLLGHPRKCPHDEDIPEGDCCHEGKREVENLITNLDRVDIGQQVKIVYIGTEDHAILHKLASYGIIPGAIVSVHQKSPTLIVQKQNLQLALDKSIVENISVRKFW